MLPNGWGTHMPHGTVKEKKKKSSRINKCLLSKITTVRTKIVCLLFKPMERNSYIQIKIMKGGKKGKYNKVENMK